MPPTISRVNTALTVARSITFDSVAEIRQSCTPHLIRLDDELRFQKRCKEVGVRCWPLALVLWLAQLLCASPLRLHSIFLHHPPDAMMAHFALARAARMAIIWMLNQHRCNVAVDFFVKRLAGALVL